MTDLKLEPGKSYETRDGRVVRVLCVDRKHVYSVVALYPDAIVGTWTLNGEKYILNGNHADDLIREHVPAKVVELTVTQNSQTGDWCADKQGDSGNWEYRGRIRIILRGKDFDVEKVND